SIYDAEMYRILHNWLAKVHSFDIIGQWHLKKVCEDGGYHHLYCDLTIKKRDDPSPVAVLELLATTSIPELNEHFKRVFNYADLLKPTEVWVIHFSREDDSPVSPALSVISQMPIPSPINTHSDEDNIENTSDACQPTYMEPKLLEEKEINDFLYEKNKENNMIRERNREKKIQAQVSHNASSVPTDSPCNKILDTEAEEEP
ncbi:17803_t:CDS:2, partial [Racocetra fulgida]